MTYPIKDNQSLIAAKTKFGTPLKTYDDGSGPLWVFSQSLGVVAVIRAQSWSSANDIVEDEILVPIDPADILEAYGYSLIPESSDYLKEDQIWEARHESYGMISICGSKAKLMEVCQAHLQAHNPQLEEGYSYQPNAQGTGIVQHDLVHESLDLLTHGRQQQLGISLTIEEG